MILLLILKHVFFPPFYAIGDLILIPHVEFQLIHLILNPTRCFKIVIKYTVEIPICVSILQSIYHI